MANGMNGIIVPVLRRTEFNYSYLVAGTYDFTIARALNCAPFGRIGYTARLHNRNIGAGASLQFLVRGVNPTDEDSQDFVLGTDLGSTSTIVTATAVPSLLPLTSVITDAQSPFVRLVLRVIQPAAPVTIWAQLSGDFVFRSN